MRKTSLSLSEALFQEAKREAERTNRTISAVIIEWAQAGRKALKQGGRKKGAGWQPVSLGAVSVDLTKRSHWMDALG